MSTNPHYTPIGLNEQPNNRGANSEDAPSFHSLTPINQPSRPAMQVYPPSLSNVDYMPSNSTTSTSMPRPTHQQRSSSWDIVNSVKKLGQDYEHFDSRNAANRQFQFADGDVPKAGVAKLYNWLLNVSIVTRWALFIVPVLAIIWIPGVLGLTVAKKKQIFKVDLIWWSIWLSVLWGGWWGALAAARTLPYLLRGTIGVISVHSRKYIAWLQALHRFVAFFGWTIASWTSFLGLISARANNVNALQFLARFLFGLVLCAGVLLGEKFAIQLIAQAFHERSYADRILEQKRARNILVILYQHSMEMPDRDDTLRDGPSDKGSTVDPKRLLKKALRGFREVAQTTTTAFGNVASEIAGSSVLQPNSPQERVASALASANKSRLLARRLFYSFRSPGSKVVVLTDIAMYFPTPEEAIAAFSLFDKDGNGDCTRDEFEAACLECHREQLSIANSLQDLDSAVGRLDNILMSLYFVVALLIIAVTLETELATLITGAGTLILGLSWLIGGSLQEVLTSIIFIFVKHPFDVGDRIKIDTSTFTVKEIRLLSTIFLDEDSCQVQSPNVVLNTKNICNLRRSPQMSESFVWDVSFSTTFEDIEALRAKMLAFVKAERRDFLPAFDVLVVDFPDQEKMILKSDIKYKSNWQLGALKAKRRNMWICALKTALAELKIYGPAGPPAPPVMPVPSPDPTSLQELTVPRGKWAFSDKNAVALDPSGDVFEEKEELYMTNPRKDFRPGTSAGTVQMPQVHPLQSGAGAESHELTSISSNIQ